MYYTLQYDAIIVTSRQKLTANQLILVILLHYQSNLGVVECVDKVLVVENVSLGLKQQFENAVLNCLELSLVGVDLDYQLVPLLLKIRSLQTHHVAARPFTHQRQLTD